MSIINKITPGPWTYRLAKWHPNAPPAGFSIMGSVSGTHHLAGLNVTGSLPIMTEDILNKWKPEPGTFLTVPEAEANAKAIASVPEMLSIINRLSRLNYEKDNFATTEAYKLSIEARQLLNELNK